MYSVSQAYINALRAPAKTRRITGYVGSEAFSDENILQGSFIVSNACSEGNDVKIGSVYMGTLQCTLRGIDLTGQWYGKMITVSEGLLIGYDGQGDPIWEDVPLGVFTVYEALHRDEGVAITAYDSMKKLDAMFPYEELSAGQPWDYLQIIRMGCGIILAQTENQIKALPNGTRGFVLAMANDIETYRDLLYWVAQTLGCFATFNRQGELELRKYGSTSVYTMAATERWQGASFSDFVTKYTAISLTYIETGISSRMVYDVDDGLTYDLGANPFLQNGDQSEAIGNILDAISVIRYTPFQVQRSGCPMLDLGDVITFTGGIGAGRTGCVMSYNYTYHAEYEIMGFGSNPALIGVGSAEDKALTSAMRRANGNEIQFYNYTNAKTITVNDRVTQIIYLRFGSMKTTIVTFHAEIKLNASITSQQLDTIKATVTYFYNRMEVEYKPVETWIEGTHLLHLLYYFPVEGAEVNTLSVRMVCDGEIFIDRANIQACLWGQGLAASSNWDGWLEFEENVGEITFATTPEIVDAIGDELDVSIHTNPVIEIEDEVGEITFATTPTTVDTIHEQLYMNKQRMGAVLWADLLEYTWEDVENNFLW